MQRSKNDVWVGLFVLLGALALVFLALQSANLLTFSVDRGYPVTAKFDFGLAGFSSIERTRPSGANSTTP